MITFDQQSAILVVGFEIKCERFVPLRVQRGLDGPGLPLDALAIVRNDFAFHVRIRQAVRVHWNQILA